MEEIGLAFRPFLHPAVLAVVCVGALALAVAAYARTTRPVAPGLKRGIVALRVLSVLAVLVCLWRPSIQTTHHEVIKRPLLLLVDVSRSMREISDVPGAPSRLGAITATLEANSSRIDALNERYDVVRLEFGRGLVSRDEAERSAGVSRSAYGLAIEQAFRDVADGQCDAIVVLGDGAHNYGPPDPVESAASLAAEGVPVYTVGVGQERGTEDLRDVKLASLEVPKTALLFTTVPVRVDAIVRGCEGLPVTVHMQVDGQPLDKRTVVPASPDEVVPLEFDLTAETTGEHKVVVQAEPVPKEMLDANNTAVSYMRVVSGGLRVALFDVVRPESKFIARALAGAEHLALRRVLTLPGRALPDAQTDADRYDVIILGDLAADELLPSRLAQIPKAVTEQGKGLIVLLGPASTGFEGWAGTSIADLLPAEVKGLSVLEGERQFTPSAEHMDHPALALDAQPAASQRAWAGMPALAGAYGKATPKRGATVLASDGKGNPLLIVHRAGPGRVACLTADTTYRWYFTEKDTQDRARKFWRQLALWAGGRDEPPREGVRLDLSRQQVQPDEEVTVKVAVTGPDGAPVRDAEIALTATGADGRPAALVASYSRTDEAYVARYRPAVPGEQTITAEAHQSGSALGEDRARLQVVATDAEMEDPLANLSLLRRMAAATADVGGRYYHYAQANDLFSELDRRGDPLKLSTSERADVWDSWPTFVLLTLVLASEWTLRRWKGLV